MAAAAVKSTLNGILPGKGSFSNTAESDAPIKTNGHASSGRANGMSGMTNGHQH
jgi:hypothetical protein